jgi:cytochrome c oxidase subunit 2
VGELHTKLHAKTRFELTAGDVLHSFSIPAFRLKQDAIPGRVVAGWFEPVVAGQFDLQCAEICGTGHSVMAGRVIVHPPAEFDQFMTAHAGSASGDRALVRAGSRISNAWEN